MIGTVQQVAGAAGIALFVSIMSLKAAEGIGAGMEPVAATAEGLQAAFTWGAAISLLMLVASFFVRRPPKNVAPV